MTPGKPLLLPKRLLRAPLLKALYPARSDRQLIAQLDYELFFR
ncbi:transposase [Bradyrhizobium lablabi]